MPIRVNPISVNPVSEQPGFDERARLEAAQRGDRRALEQLLAAEAPRVARFAARMCNNPSDAEEVAQEALIAAARTLPNFRGDSSVSTWLHTIVRSFCMKQRRRGRSVRQADTSFDDPATGPSGEMVDAQPMADAHLEGRQLGRAIELAVSNLAPMYREVLVLRDMEGLSAPEVASALGLKLEAVKSRLHRARLAVREQLAPVLDLPDLPPAAPGKCPDVLAMYSRHVEGDIRPETCATMEAHLTKCPRCQGLCDSLRRTLVMCKTSPGPELPIMTQNLVRVALQRALGR